MQCLVEESGTNGLGTQPSLLTAAEIGCHSENSWVSSHRGDTAKAGEDMLLPYSKALVFPGNL